MTKPTIGFIGTGRMGGPMAGRLMDAGYALSVYDTQDEATAPLHGSRADASSKGRRVGAGMTIVQWQSGVPYTVFPPELALAQPIWPKS
jgi:branched-chain amino acid transport system substrate-binding protein